MDYINYSTLVYWSAFIGRNIKIYNPTFDDVHNQKNLRLITESFSNQRVLFAGVENGGQTNAI